MTKNIDVASGYKCIERILASQTVGEVKSTVMDFISATEDVVGYENGMYAYMLCNWFDEAIGQWAKRYSSVAWGWDWNAVIVPPEDAPIMYLYACVPSGCSPANLIGILKKFVELCDGFTPPICDAISASEIKRVLSSAQRTYRLLDIIAPKEPLRILRFANSHAVYNSQCGIPSDNSQATVFSFHPNDVSVFDRLCIFAHELGHALHLSLTGDVGIIPRGFAEFNKSIGVNLETLKEQQEGFADSVALAILNTKGLRSHLPTEWSKSMSYSHGKYLRELCTATLRKLGAFSEPLPTPYSPFEKMVTALEAQRAVAHSMSRV